MAPDHETFRRLDDLGRTLFQIVGIDCDEAAFSVVAQQFCSDVESPRGGLLYIPAQTAPAWQVLMCRSSG